MLPTTLRNFSGGWNIDDTDLNLSPSFLTNAKNVVISGDGSLSVRNGVKLLANIGGGVINCAAFKGAIVAVRTDGTIWRINALGVVTEIWSNSIAAVLPGAPSGWGDTTFASFEQFDGALIINNGVDKPLEVDSNFIVDYLQDPATGTNINIPICRYAVAVSRYLCFLGDPLFPNRVHISARDAPGTWFGDPPPNDATFTDVASNLANASTIRGAAAFRGRLLVFFAEGTVIGQLGIYDDDNNHTPNFDDAIDQYGCLSHRAAIAVGDDGIISDFTSISTLRRTVLSQNFKPEPLSDLIQDDYVRSLLPLNVERAEDRVFAVWDNNEGRYMLFVPNAATVAATTETRVYVLHYSQTDRQVRWTYFTGWNFTCGCRTLQGNVVFGDKVGDLWLYGNSQNRLTKDYIRQPGTGQPIAFEWETPWIDFRARSQTKTSKYVGFDTEGTGEFACQMFVDRYLDAPACEMQFSGGDQGQFGKGPQPFGGGRNTSYEKNYAWPSKFKLAKMRFSGSVSEPLKFVAFTLHYLSGNNLR